MALFRKKDKYIRISPNRSTYRMAILVTKSGGAR